MSQGIVQSARLAARKWTPKWLRTLFYPLAEPFIRARLRTKAPPRAQIPRQLNFGCGYDKRAGYFNVDIRADCWPDLLLKPEDFSQLPRQHFDLILANDVLEHIPRVRSMNMLLEWADLLRPEGVLELQTSDILGLMSQMQGEDFTEQYNWTKCLFGNQEHEGDYHYTGFTQNTLRAHLLAAGFDEIEMRVEKHWLLHARARKSEDWTELLALRCPDEAFLHAAYQRSIWQPIDALGHNTLLQSLKRGQSRRSVLKRLFGSEARLFRIAQRAGF